MLPCSRPRTPPCRCPGCSTRPRSGTRTRCTSSEHSAAVDTVDIVDTGKIVFDRSGINISELRHTHVVIPLADELVEEGEVGAIEAVPAHGAGHALLVVKPE